MLKRVIGVFEPFVLALLATMLVASLLPVSGAAARVVYVLANAGIVLLFFLHGAKLSREAVLSGFLQWRLHLLVLAVTFVLFPALGLGLSSLPILPTEIAAGLLFLTLVPSTVQSSIALTAIARGNVSAAICTAAFSNLAGIIATPVLVALLIRDGSGEIAISGASIRVILLQLLLPFLVGHLLRPWVGPFIARQKQMVGFVDRGSILLVVYSAFSAAVVDQLWIKVSGPTLALLLLCCCALLAAVLILTYLLARASGLAREDAIVLQIAGTFKSLAAGVPMAGVLFPPAQAGMLILPLMLYHQIQLVACAILARSYGRKAEQAQGTDGTKNA